MNFSDRAILEALFKTTISETLICPKCGDRSTRNDIKYRIQIPITGPDSLLNLIQGEGVFGTATIHQRRCDTCNTEAQRTEQSRQILTAPEIMVLQIFRFGAERVGKHGYRDFIRRDDIAFTEHLELTQLVEGRVTLKYRVLAVVQNKGATIHTGHYITVVRGPRGDWTEIDNQHAITKVNPRLGSELISFRHASREGDKSRPQDKFLPYLIFYQRVGGEVADAPIRTNDEGFWDDREKDLAATRRKRVRISTARVSKKLAPVRYARKDRH